MLIILAPLSPCGSVDDLESVDDIEIYVEASHALLVVLGSAKYFASMNCIRELKFALDTHLPLVRIHDSNADKNGSSLDALKRAAPRNAAALFDVVDDSRRGVIPWNRFQDFQLNCLAAIGEALLLATPLYHYMHTLPLYIPGALPWAGLTFERPTCVYVSPNNRTAAGVASELRECFEQLQQTDERWARDTWLLLIDRSSFEGEVGAQLVAELHAELMNGVSPVVLFEPEVDDFGDIISCTPPSLLNAGLYKGLIIQWHRGLHRRVSMQLVARALGARPLGWRAKVCAGATSTVRAVAACGARFEEGCMVLMDRRRPARARVQENQLLVSRGGRLIERQSSVELSARTVQIAGLD